jgi:hypothetical protein
VALFGGVLVGFDGLFLLAVLVGLETELEEIERTGFLADARLDVERAGRTGIAAKQATESPISINLKGLNSDVSISLDFFRFHPCEPRGHLSLRLRT